MTLSPVSIITGVQNNAGWATNKYMTRNDLAKKFYGKTLELGVAAGDFSNEILNNERVDRHYAIDKWDDHHDIHEYLYALNRLACYKCLTIRARFSEALKLFEDSFFDCIYIDGYAHTGQNDGETLDSWWPKLKSGGIFSGHDYHNDWILTKTNVNKFIIKHSLRLFLTDDVKYPSWYIIKP